MESVLRMKMKSLVVVTLRQVLHFFLLVILLDKKQLDNNREHSGTEQMSSNLKAQLKEGVIKQKFKFSNDDDDDDFCLPVYLDLFSLSLSLTVSFSLSFILTPISVRLDILFPLLD